MKTHFFPGAGVLFLLKLLLLASISMMSITQAKVAEDPTGVSNSVGGTTTPVVNVIKGGELNFRFSASNPTGSAPGISNFTLLVNGAPQGGATFIKIAEGEFVLRWTALLPQGYPAPGKLLQTLAVRYAAMQKTIPLGRVDVAEWEGVIAGVPSGYIGPGYQVRSHYSGANAVPTLIVGTYTQTTIRYRGPKSISLLIYGGGDSGVRALISDSTRYPLFLFPDLTSAPQLLDVSSPVSYPDKGTFYRNISSRRVTVKEPTNIFLEGETKFAAFPQIDPRDNFNMVPYLATFMESDRERTIYETMIRYVDGRFARNMHWVTFYDGLSGVRPIYRKFELMVDARIVPHTAGTLEYAGLPIDTGSDIPLLPVPSATWHKIMLKVGPDAGAISNGIRLKLGTGEGGGGEEAPQPGFSLQVQNASGLSALPLPANGEIDMSPTSDLYQKLVSPEGLTLFLKRGTTVNEMHRLGLDLLPRDATYSSHRIAALDLLPMELKAFKRGTLNAPGAEVPAGTGEFGYETVMMENADSESSAPSTTRDCDEPGAAADLNPYRNAEDDDLVKIVLKWPAGIKPAGASLKLLHVGMKVDATQTTADAAVSTSGPSRLNFYKADGTRITNPTTDLQIADLANAPASSYLSKILTDGEVTIFIEGADRFGDLPNDPTLLGGAQLKWEFTQGATTATAKLLVYRGGFLRFMQPTGAPGTVGDFEFWDGKGRVKHKIGKPIFGKEFETDVTDYGIKLATWKAKSGKTIDNPVEKIRGKAYNVKDGFGHTPPGWWKTKRRTDFTGAQPDQISGTGPNKIIKQGGYVRWKQDDETDAANRYTTVYRYDASNTHDAAIGEPTSIRFKYDMDPITPSEAQNRTDIQIHPDGECTDNVMAGTAGCIGIQSYSYCEQVLRTIENYHGLKVKVQLSQP